MRVMMLGLRGIPATEGGIERHVESLSPLLVERGIDVEVLLRKPFKPVDGDCAWRGVRRTWLWSPSRTGLEAFVHSVVGVLYAAIRRPDVVHIHGIGPAITAPLARLFGLRVVMTHHGFDYEREKWGRLPRTILRLGEWAGTSFSHARIVISRVIRDSVEQRFHRGCDLIPNGVFVPELTEASDRIEPFGLQPKKYVLQVSRFVPEKRQLDLVRAFLSAELSDWKLVLVGSIDASNDYAEQVRHAATADERIVLTGFQTGETLHQLFGHAGLFVLPSSHEGLPIALLEALSYGLPVLASDIPAHLDLGLAASNYFTLGDTNSLAHGLEQGQALEWTAEYADQQRKLIADRYDWDRIAEQTAAVYRTVCDGGQAPPNPLQMNTP